MYYLRDTSNSHAMDTPIKRFIEVDGKIKTEITMGKYTDVNLKNFSWKYIAEKSRMGWVQNSPPVRPFIIASKGMLEIANKLLQKKKKQT